MMIVVIYYINFVFRGPLGRILHSNWCHPLKIKVIIVKKFGPTIYSKSRGVLPRKFTTDGAVPLNLRHFSLRSKRFLARFV